MRRRVTPQGVLIGVALVVFVTFWTWALFFASKEPVNRIGDTTWGARAEQICAESNVRRERLADFTKIDPKDPAQLAARAAAVDRATDILEEMLDAVVATPPTDPKGRDLVPQWEADYRTYLGNRRTYAATLRSGQMEDFRVAEVRGIPITERLRVFAADNGAPACAPPRDI